MGETDSENCYCKDCMRFCHELQAFDSLLDAFRGIRKVRQLLTVANGRIAEAWLALRSHRQHRFVPAPPRPFETFGSLSKSSAHQSNSLPDGGSEHVAYHASNDGTQTFEVLLAEEASSRHEGYCEKPTIDFGGVQTQTRAHETTDPDHVDNGGYHEKFMVCDHCKAHGLSCNEASVCNQCQLFNQPCVHRWCPNSPKSKSDCSNHQCRYAHSDSITDTADQARWVILPGNLPRHWSKGRITAMSLLNLESSPNLQKLDKRQVAASAELTSKTLDELGTVETVYHPCSCQFGQYAEDNDESDRDEEDSDEKDIYEQDKEAADDDHEVGSNASACRSCGSRENYVALYPCGCWECHVCAIAARRHRKTCTACGRDAPQVIFAADREMRFGEFRRDDFESIDMVLGIAYETAMIQRDSMWILEQEQQRFWESFGRDKVR